MSADLIFLFIKLILRCQRAVRRQKKKPSAASKYTARLSRECTKAARYLDNYSEIRIPGECGNPQCAGIQFRIHLVVKQDESGRFEW